MSNCQFWFSIALWTAILLLSTTQLGAIIGFFELVAIAFFIAPIVRMTGAMGSEVLKPHPHLPLYIALAIAALVTIFALFGVMKARISFKAGDTTGARGEFARAYRTAVIPWSLLLCALSLPRYWSI